MKKPGLLLVLILVLVLPAGLHAGNLDLIVMIDTSASMQPFFDDLLHYVFTDLLIHNLKHGDTFHLLSFSSTTTVELEETIANEQSAENILRKINFLKEKLILGRYTDLVQALKDTVTYVENLPATNAKRIFLLTDGIHDPPPGSPYSNENPEKVNEEMRRLAQKIITKGGWNVNILQIPTDDMIRENLLATPTTKGPDDSQGQALVTPYPRSQYLDEFAKKLGITIYPYNSGENENLPNRILGFPTLLFPNHLGRQGRNFSVPFSIRNFLQEPVIIKLNRMEDNEGNVLTEAPLTRIVPAESTVLFEVPVTLPAKLAQGELALPVKLVFDDDSRISPSEGFLNLTYSSDPVTGVINMVAQNFLIVILVLIAIVLFFLFFLFIRKQILDDAFSDRIKPIHVSAWAHKPQEDMKDMIELRVQFQNPNIGYRNIHKLEEGKPLGVGGSHSTFLVFLVPLPPDIAEISLEDGVFTFTPLRDEYFPELTKPLRNCLDQEIKLKTLKNYQMVIRFVKYVSPLYQINALLHSINQKVE